jgi:hypothetical protein
VEIVQGAGDLVAACERILQRTAGEHAAHAQALSEVVARTSWDNTAQAMAELIAQADEAVDAMGDAGEPAQAQPTVDDGAPRHLADATQAVSMVGPAAGLSKRATAAG